MNLPKGETRQELLNRAFLYVLIIAFSVLIFLRVKSLIFDLFVAIVLAALAEPVVYRLSKKISRQSAALVAVSLILLVIGATLFHFFKEGLWTLILGWQYVALGVLIVVIVIYFPEGLMGWLREKYPERFGEVIDEKDRKAQVELK